MLRFANVRAAASLRLAVPTHAPSECTLVPTIPMADVRKDADESARGWSPPV